MVSVAVSGRRGLHGGAIKAVVSPRTANILLEFPPEHVEALEVWLRDFYNLREQIL